MHRLSPKATYVTILGAEGFARGLLFVALVSYWVVQARLNPLQLVLLGTALEGTLFLLQVPTGAFADAIGRRPATVIGYALLGAGLGLQAFTRDFGSLLVLQAISGGAWAFLIGSIEAWIAQQAGTDGLERVFLRGGQAGMAGLMVGLCMTVLAGQVDPRLPIFAGGALLVVVSAMAAVLMTEEPISRSPVSKSRWREIVLAGATGARRIGANRTLFVLVLVALALGISSEGWDRLYTAHLMRDLRLASVGHLAPVGWLALVGLAEGCLGLVAFQLAMPRVAGREPGALLSALYVSRAALMVCFALIPWLPAALAAFLGAETVRRLAEPLIDAWIARETPQEVRATVLSVVGQADSLGQIAAGPLVGLLGSVASVAAALTASAGLMLPAGLLALRAGKDAAPVSVSPDPARADLSPPA
ncbi:MAG: MFS transporter [Chloroflexi bacterium]|nr:MAG: MFS transporter [Chloroflexota bacterium]